MRMLSVILFVSLMLPFAMKVGITINYVAKYSKYVEACVNKDRTDFQCNGSCKLADMMNAVDQNTPSKPNLPENITAEVSPFIFFSLETTAVSPATLQLPGSHFNLRLPEFIYREINSPPPDVIA